MELLQGFCQQTLYGYFHPKKLILIEKYNSLYKHLITVRKNDISWRGYRFHFLPLDFIPGGGSLLAPVTRHLLRKRPGATRRPNADA